MLFICRFLQSLVELDESDSARDAECPGVFGVLLNPLLRLVCSWRDTMPKQG